MQEINSWCHFFAALSGSVLFGLSQESGQEREEPDNYGYGAQNGADRPHKKEGQIPVGLNHAGPGKNKAQFHENINGISFSFPGR